MGVFDGVHLGHQSIFKKVVQRARSLRGTPVVYTFDPHPVKILAPHAAPPMINTLEQRVELIHHQGIKTVVVEKFTKSYSHQTPEAFFKNIILKRLRPCAILVGYNFTFGVHRSGNTDLLKKFCEKAGITITIIQPYFKGEILVSSTQVRQCIAKANLAKASELLNRPYFIEGKVVRGRGVGGRELGIQTANITPENDSILPSGVYVTWTRIGSHFFESVTNIGQHPTFGAGPTTIETHLFNFNKNIVGKKLRVSFLMKIREEKKFPSPKALATQIKKDIQFTKRYFRTHP